MVWGGRRCEAPVGSMREAQRRVAAACLAMLAAAKAAPLVARCNGLGAPWESAVGVCVRVGRGRRREPREGSSERRACEVVWVGLGAVLWCGVVWCGVVCGRLTRAS